jgi:hypothetical protein
MVAFLLIDIDDVRDTSPDDASKAGNAADLVCTWWRSASSRVGRYGL